VREGSIERLVIIFPGALGDLLLALPALRILRRRHARSHYTLVVPGWLRAVATLAGVADRTASLDAADATYLFGGSAMPAWLEGHPTVYSWLGAGDAVASARLRAAATVARLLHVERGPGRMHAAAAYVHAVGGTGGVGCLTEASRISLPAADAVDAPPGGTTAPLLAFHAGAGAAAKRWAEAGFTAVAAWWTARGGALVEIAGPAEDGSPLVPAAHQARNRPLPELAALLARVDLYLGNDSGVSHLAGAVGSVGAVIFGPTPARRWRPVSRRLVALQARARDAGGIPLAALPAERVCAALARLARQRH
jgi:ADP-heptose:LPS heptosyltransferase